MARRLSSRPPRDWRRDWLSHRFLVQTVEGLPLIHFSLKPSFFRREGGVELEEAARGLPDLEQVILLGWSLVLATQRPHAR